jgi:hypothetical protein
MSDNRQLVPMRSLAVAKATGTAIAIIDSRVSLPKPIVTGVKDVLIAFPAGVVGAAEDKVRLLQIYAEAVDGSHEAVAAFALRHLKFHNPRNPFPPTPQDVRELCEKVMRTSVATLPIDAQGRLRAAEPFHRVTRCATRASARRPTRVQMAQLRPDHDLHL